MRSPNKRSKIGESPPRRLLSLVDWKRVVVALALFTIVGSRSAGQESLSSADEQFLFVTRVLTYDRNLKERAGDALVIGILYQNGYAPSANLKAEFDRVIAETSVERVRGLQVRYVPLEVQFALPSARQLAQQKITALYVTPLQGIQIGSLATLCRSARVTSITPIEQYVDEGLAVGIVPGDPRPNILINLPAARQEGADFSSQLLRLATLVH